MRRKNRRKNDILHGGAVKDNVDGVLLTIGRSNIGLLFELGNGGSNRCLLTFGCVSVDIDTVGVRLGSTKVCTVRGRVGPGFSNVLPGEIGDLQECL